MPFGLLIIGVILLVAGVRNTQNDLFTLVKGDFTGDGNFIFWFFSILLIGLVGYVPKLKPISTGFLALVIIVLVFSKGNPNNPNGGLFGQLTQGLNSTTSGKTPQQKYDALNTQLQDVQSQMQKISDYFSSHPLMDQPY